MTQINLHLPIAVIGAGPVGLAAAAHLLARGLRPLVFEAGSVPGANLRSYAHVQLFSPWRYNVDKAARALLEQRGLELKGITSDASNLYPEPISQVFGEVPHQICEFHVLKEITKAVLRAVAKVRKELAAMKPKLGRGRPSSAAARQAARRRQGIDQKVGELFQHRYLFVQHDLTPAQRRRLHHITRGRPELRTLRKIMDEVYRLFDRRCRTQTAVRKLAKLRRRVRRFKTLGDAMNKLNSPNLEKALEFLDDKLLGSTSNAVERSNRRFRKAQNSIYSVRTKEHLEQRLALDMHREQRATKRQQTTKTLHRARSKHDSLH